MFNNFLLYKTVVKEICFIVHSFCIVKYIVMSQLLEVSVVFQVTISLSINLLTRERPSHPSTVTQ